MNRRHLLIAPVSFILALVAGAASVPSRPAYSEEVPGKPLMDKILFIDDGDIEQQSGLERVLHSPRKYEGNPIVRGDRPWETSGAYCPRVIYDSKEALYKMWYNADAAMHTCYATSRDGLDWDKPFLDVTSLKGYSFSVCYYFPTRNGHLGRSPVWTTITEDLPNNMVLFGTHGTSVIRDERDPDPDRRYKMFYLSQGGHHDEYRTDGWTEERLPRHADAYCVAFSSDGIHWKRYEGNPIGPASDAPGCVFWDPYRQQYRSYMRTFSRGGRSIGIMESTDFVKWSKPATIFAPDKDDWALEHQYYCMHVWMEGPLYVGIVWIFDVHADSAGRGKTWPELVTSRDGRHFTRVGRGRPFIPLGPAGGWDTGGVYLPYNPVAKDRELLFYYSGYKARHPVPGMRLQTPIQSAIGAAILRQDGYASLDNPDASPEAAAQEGRLVTRPFKINGPVLYMNAEVKPGGSIKVGLQDEQGKPLPGYTVEENVAVEAQDSVAIPLHWRGNEDVSELQGQAAKIDIRSTNARLYAVYQ